MNVTHLTIRLKRQQVISLLGAIFTAAILAVVLTGLCGCSSQSDTNSSNQASSSSRSLRFFTGGEAGTYYAFGSVLAQHATNNVGLNIVALSSGGSQANVEALEDGSAELGFCQSDVMTYAYTGTNLFDHPINDSFSVVGTLFREQIQIVTLDPGIKTVDDLKGKRVSLGAAGSGMYFGALDVLDAYGLAESDLRVTRQGNSDAMYSLENDQIDAAFLVAPAPTTAVVELASAKQVYLVSIDDEHANKIIAASPYYAADTVSAGTYTGLDVDVQTVSVSANILARNDVSEDDVYLLCKDIYDNPAALVELHAKYAEVSVEQGASVTSVPYHPGAAKYFAERGYTVAQQ